VAHQPSFDEKHLRELVEQRWTIKLQESKDGRHTGRILEIPEIEVLGKSTEEALNLLRDARADWLRSALQQGKQIPQPRPHYSGKIFIRTSPTLHESVVKAAAREGVSASQWVGEILARELGSRGNWAPPTA